MARTREFSEAIALDKAIELFWSKGYANTSMRTMVKTTGVAHAGLYTAFGSKFDLFIRALETYETRIFTHLFAGLESNKASLKDIKKFFEFVRQSRSDKYFCNGCFIANSAIEFGGKNNQRVNQILDRTLERQTKAFEGALKNAQQEKQVSANLSADNVAAQLTALFYGCANLIKMHAPDALIKQSIDASLGVLSN